MTEQVEEAINHVLRTIDSANYMAPELLDTWFQRLGVAAKKLRATAEADGATIDLHGPVFGPASSKPLESNGSGR